MGDVFTTLDLVIFFAALFGVMALGLYAGRREETSEDYFLAGRKIPWWGVAGSIFGSNVSANHMVGMMGIGFSIGFAQSHFELGAIFGLLALCYGFLPVYRKLNLYTLSEYLGRRYDDRSRIAYAVIMVTIMAVVQMVPGLYIGARSICVLAGGEAAQTVEREPVVLVADLEAAAEPALDADNGEPDDAPPAPARTVVNQTWYAVFVIALALVAAAYTIFGGLKAVIWTDVMQSFLLLAAGIVIAILTFHRLGGWGEMMALDAAAGDEARMGLYRPVNHSDLPWTGVFTGLIAMHFFYWGTNQFIVQRALSARSDAQARLGIVAAGFLKLLIPFFAIAGGVAAFYLFERELPTRAIAPDAAFTELVKLVILPIGPGIIGLIAAGLIGAILSSIDSMMNSAATIVSVDVYKKYINPGATHRQMILVGRLSIVAFMVLAAWMAITVIDPNSEANFFLTIADQQNLLTPGILVAFVLGMFWRRGTGTAAIVTIVAGIVFSWGLDAAYNATQSMNPAVYSVLTGQKDLRAVRVDHLPEEMRAMTVPEMESYVQAQEHRLTPVNRLLGPKLNFFHRVVGVIALCALLYVFVSRLGRTDPEKSRLVWTDLGGHAPGDLRRLLTSIAVSIGVFAALGWSVVTWGLPPTLAAWTAAAWTLAMYVRPVRRSLARRRAESAAGAGGRVSLLSEDRLWAALLCAVAVFMHFYFY